MRDEERKLRRSSKEVEINPKNPETDYIEGKSYYRIDLDINEFQELTNAQKQSILKILLSNETKESENSLEESQHSNTEQIKSPLTGNGRKSFNKQTIQTVLVFAFGLIVGAILIILATGI